MHPVAVSSGEEFRKFESVIVHGDLAKLSPPERLQYYKLRCEKIGLDPVTQPFALIVLNNKLTLYATKAATEQIIRRDGLSVRILKQEILPGNIYVVTVEVSGRDGRVTQNIGAICLAGLNGEALCNAMMKATTKSIRRAVLSHSGLGLLDETEVDTIRDARRVDVNMETGEVIEASPQRQLPEPTAPALAQSPEPPAVEPPAPAAAAPTQRPGLSAEMLEEIQKSLRELGRSGRTKKENSEYSCRIMGLQKISDFSAQDWEELCDVLKRAVQDKKACFASWKELTDDPENKEHRCEEWGTAVGRRIESSSDLAPCEWASLRSVLQKSLQEAPSQDPFAIEGASEELFGDSPVTPGAFR